MPSPDNGPRRTLLLTGASRGIGHATVKRFSAAGWRVITCSRHAFFQKTVRWEMGPEDHIQVDLSESRQHGGSDRGDQAAFAGRPVEYAGQQRSASRPRPPAGKRLSAIETDLKVWQHVFQVNFFAPIMLARGLINELKATHGSVVNVTSIAGSRVHPFAGAAYATSKAALASLTPRNGGRFLPARYSRQRNRARRDRHRDSVTRHGQDRRAANPDASPRHTG